VLLPEQGCISRAEQFIAAFTVLGVPARSDAGSNDDFSFIDHERPLEYIHQLLTGRAYHLDGSGIFVNNREFITAQSAREAESPRSLSQAFRDT
jgi:hypothetical protein